MKNYLYYSKIALIALMLLSPFSGYSQGDGKQLLQDAISTWDVLSTNIKINSVKNNEVGGVRTLGGNATIFGHTVGLEVAFKGKEEIRRIAIDFPESASITTEHFRQLIGQNVNEVFPQGFGAGIGIKHLAVDMKSKKIDGANIVLTFGTWAPFGSGSTVKLSDIEAEFGIMNIQRRKEFVVGMKSSIFLPKDITEDFGIGASRLSMKGYVNSQTKKLAMGVALSSEYIPLVADRSVMMKEAQFEFYVEKGKPGMALGGQIEIRPKQGEPFKLNGEMSIDITGKIFGAGWMSPGDEIRNPFGLSDKVYITRAGLGFGLDFKTTPIPAPSMAIEGGIAIKNSPTGSVIFGGEATLCVDPTEPNKTMIDAKVTNLTLKHFIDAFSDQQVPSDFVQTLRKINFKTLHFTIVPPGAGSIEIFGKTYEPGVYAEGVFNYEGFTGAMFIDIKDGKVEAFGGMSAIKHTGFELSGASNEGGPYIFLSLNASDKKLSLAANGKLKILGGAEQLTDIYFSDKGFNAVVRTKLFDRFSAELDIAGVAMTSGSTIYVKATMDKQDNLIEYISTEASKEIDKLANGLQKDVDKAKADLERLRPELNRKREKVRKEMEASCALLNQKKNQERERATKKAAISKLKSEIPRLESKLKDERYKRAKDLGSTNCGGNSKRFGDYCYTCPSGFEWNYPIALNNADGCIKKAKKLTEPATPRGNIKKPTFTDPVPVPCPKGQFADITTGKCYTCPPGYTQDAAAPINSGYKCFKMVSAKTTSPVKGKYIKCSDRSFEDLNKCWECPSGYSRKVTVFPVNGPKACELNNIAQREATIRNKRLELARLESELTLITNGIGELATKLSGVASSVCEDARNTDVINAHPEVAPLSLLVNEAQVIVDGAGKVGTGSLRGASWIVKNGGSALGIVDVHHASFEGCVSSVNSGRVKMAISGDYADQPFSGSFNINLKSPDEAIKWLARQLTITSSPKATNSNGSCRRPNVPRPVVDGKIAEMLAMVGPKTTTKLTNAEKTKPRPSWAGNQQTKNRTINPADFDISKSEEIKKMSNGGGGNSGGGGSNGGGNSGNNIVKGTSAIIKSNRAEVGSRSISPFMINGNTYMYVHGASGKDGGIYQMQNNGTFGNYKGDYKEPSSVNNTRVQAVPYSVGNINSLLFYGKSSGSAIKAPLTTDGSLDKPKMSLVDNGSWRKTWTDILPYQIGNSSYMLFFENATGVIEIYSAASKNFQILTTKTGSYTLGSRANSILKIHEVGNQVYLSIYNTSTGSINFYTLSSDGKLTSGSRYTLKSGWTNVAPYEVGGKSYIYLYNQHTGDSEINELRANAVLSQATYISKGWTKNWDMTVTYSVGNRAFVLYYRKNTGSAQIWELTANGKFGSLISVITGGKVQE